jgi:hypothetical protein
MPSSDDAAESKEEEGLLESDEGEEALTPPDTPSALLRLGLAFCPSCEGTGQLSWLLSDGGTMERTCTFCDGAKRVTIEKAKEWVGVPSDRE